LSRHWQRMSHNPLATIPLMVGDTPPLTPFFAISPRRNDTRLTPFRHTIFPVAKLSLICRHPPPSRKSLPYFPRESARFRPLLANHPQRRISPASAAIHPHHPHFSRKTAETFATPPPIFAATKKDAAFATSSLSLCFSVSLCYAFCLMPPSHPGSGTHPGSRSAALRLPPWVAGTPCAR
jgi:hypothetical protein